MGHKFKIGDKVKVLHCVCPEYIDKEGVVTKMDGIFPMYEGVIVTNEEFVSGHQSYGEHGYWFADNSLELIT